MGVSIVHLSMFIALQFVNGIDMSKTSDLKSGCQTEAKDWDFLLGFQSATHLIMFFSNLYREINSAQTDMSGQFMRVFEIACIPIYLYQILMSIELLSAAMIREETTVLKD